MSCHLCGSTFNVFKKEHGCKNCGFSFCGKCCCKKIVLSKLGMSKQLVCQNCYDNLTSSKNNASNFPATASQSSLLQDQSGSSKQSSAMPSQKFQGLSKEDEQLLLRLDKLKQNSATSHTEVTTSDVETRLARLKGIDLEHMPVGPVTIYRCSKPLTQVEQANLLLQEMTEETAIENSRPSAEREVEERLQRLKGFVGTTPKIQNTSEASGLQNDLNKTCSEGADSKTYRNINIDEVNSFFQKASWESEQEAKKELTNLSQDTEVQDYLNKFKQQQEKKSKGKEIYWNDGIDYSSDDNEDDDEKTKKLIQQVNAEVEEEGDSDELPWCNICNEDARLRCHGCEGDLFCRRCFKSCHDEFGLQDHTTSPYNSKN